VVTDRTRADSRNILHLLKPSSTGTAGGTSTSPSSSSIFPAGGCPRFRRPRLSFKRLRIPANKQKTAAFKATAKTTFTSRYEGTDVYAPSRSGGKIVAVYAVATVVMANYYGIPGERRRTYR
jgi:hypothetical protein